MQRKIFLFLTFIVHSAAYTCSCFGPTTFCTTLNTASSEPDVVVLAEKLSDIHYGMQVRVLDPLAGSAQLGDTLMVWGDNGALCRLPALAWSVGDTIVLGLHETDFMGNVIVNSNYPPNLEQSGDYHISVCGIYALNYDNGIVSGPIDQGNLSLPYSVFLPLIANCSLTTGMHGATGTEMFIRQDLINDQILVEMGRPGWKVEFIDLSGRVLRNATMTERSQIFSTADLPNGVVLVRATNIYGVLTEKVIIR